MRTLFILGLILLQVTAYASPQTKAAEKLRRASARVVQAVSSVRPHKILSQELRRTLGKKLRLDDAILEIQMGTNTGIPGFVAVGASGILALSGKNTGNKPVLHTISPTSNVQIGVATGGYAYVPGTKRPHAFACGGGPWRYKIYDPIHHTPLMGITLPLIGSVAFGPQTFGMSIDLPIPFAPGFKWLTGAWLTHPWLAPITGTMWKSGGWAWTRSAPLRNKLSPHLAPMKLALLWLQKRGKTAWVITAPARDKLRPHVVKAALRGRDALNHTRQGIAQAKQRLTQVRARRSK